MGYSQKHQSEMAKRANDIRDQLAKASAMLFGARYDRDVIDIVLQAIRSIGFDRIRFYSVSEDRRFLIGRSQLGAEDNFIGSRLPVSTELQRQAISFDPRPQVSKRNSNKLMFFKTVPSEKGVKEFALIPFVHGGELVGLFIADNKHSRRRIDQETLQYLVPFTSQATAIHLTRRLDEAERRAHNLSTIVQGSLRVNSAIDLNRILTATCQSAVELLGVTHSGFVRFAPSFDSGQVQAEFPDKGMIGQVLPLREVPAWVEFVRSPKPFVVPAVEKELSLGPGRDILLKNDIRSTLIVPVLSENRLLGSFGMDSIGVAHDFKDEEVELCQILAEHVARAIENAQTFQEPKRRAAQLQQLRQTKLTISPPSDRVTFVHSIIQHAVALLGARSGGIYEYVEASGELRVISDFKRQDNVGKVLKAGEGMAGRLVQSNAPYMIVNDYNSWNGKARIYAKGRRFGAVVEVPLKLPGKGNERIIGVLYVDDSVQRKFTPREARLLALFADLAAIALINADIIAKDEELLKRLKGLLRATAEIASQVGRATLDEVLSLIAKRATKILEAEACGVFLVWQRGYLSLEASYGHREGGFRKGKHLPIVSGIGSGLTGHIAYKKEIFNARGPDLLNHFAVRRAGPTHTLSGTCYSLLAIPLTKKVGAKRKLVGLLRLDNKIGSNKRPLASLAFSKQDEWILSIFAETIVVAIESSLFNEQLSKQQENWYRFLDSSANGIIATDALGNVISFNKRAEEIFGFQQIDEVLFTSVEGLYYDRGEARRIGRLLYENKDGLTSFDTHIRSKTGERIPIRLSATWLYDDQKRRIGSVGYFDRSIRKIQSLLRKASDIVTKAENLSEALQKIAEMLLSFVPRTFCRVLLRDESSQSLVIKAAYSTAPAGTKEDWDPRLGKPLVISKWTGLEEVLRQDEPQVLTWSDKRYRPNLSRLARSLGLHKHIESLLVVPLVVEGKNMGLLEIGELSQERPPFSQEEIDLTSEIAAQTTILILASLHRITARNKLELEHLHEAATAMAGALDLRQVLETVAGRARDILGAHSAAIWSYDRVQDKFIADEIVAVGMPVEELQRFREEDSKPGRTAYTVLKHGWIAVADIADPNIKFIGPATRNLLSRIGVHSFEGVALEVAGEPVGVLYVNYSQARAFGGEDRRALENFAAYAALSLRRARGDDQFRRAKAIGEAVTYVTALGDKEASLQSVLKGARDLLGCDAVVLYIHNPETKKFDYPPKHLGLNDPNGIVQRDAVPSHSLVYKMLKRAKPYRVDQVAKNGLFSNRKFAKREKIESCAAIPLAVSHQEVGVLFVNYRSPHHFTDEEIDRVSLFGLQAAVAISNARLYEQAQNRAKVLQGLYKAGRAVTSSLSLSETLNRIAEQALNVVGSAHGKQKRLSHVLIRKGLGLTFVGASFHLGSARRRNRVLKVDLKRQSKRGIVGRVARTGIAQNVGNVLNDKDYTPLSAAIRSQLSVPLKIRGRVIGVLSVEDPSLDAFNQEDVNNAELLAAQAAVAIENVQRHEYVENLYHAAQSIAKAFDLRQVLKTVAGRAKDILGADSSAIWSYDDVQDKFIADEMVAVGIPEKELQRFRREPKPGRTADTVLNRGWIGVADSRKTRYLGRSTRSFLKRIGVRSFQGIALKVGGESVGVLYVNYVQPRSFSRQDRRALENFAAYAALSLRRARLIDQLTKAKSGSETVANVTALGKHDDTLKSISAAALGILNCDAVTLYEYDPVSRKLGHPPASSGLNDPARVEHKRGFSLDSIVRTMLRRTKPYVVEHVGQNPLLRDSHFAREEEVKSCVVIPLVVGGQKVGLMFANYRSHHRFTREEVDNIALFSLQVAVAVSNAQLYDRAQKRFEALSGLSESSREITSSLDTQKTLPKVARQALQILGATGSVKGCFSHVALKNGNRLDFKASSSPQILKMLLRGVSPVLTSRKRRSRAEIGIGIAGRVARNGKSENVPDVLLDQDYNLLRFDIQSQLSVPLKIARRVIGVLSIEHPELDAFTQEDLKNTELLAAQAAIAIENARQFYALTQAQGQVGSLTALAWMGMANSVWRHAIDGYASTTRLALTLLRDELRDLKMTARQREPINEWLTTISSQTQHMLSEPIIPPLSDEEGIDPILINEYIEARMSLLRSSKHLAKISSRNYLMKKDQTILCSRDWLGRAIDILISNAVKAMNTTPVSRLTVKTRLANDAVEIAFTDTGKGIPHRIRRKLFREVIPQPFSNGMGIGLLIVQAIVQAYKGYVTVESTGAQGTTMVIGFPQTRDKG